jgi:5-methylcytosine-specific restriction endonuclease McrA
MTAWTCPCGAPADLNGAEIGGVPVCASCEAEERYETSVAMATAHAELLKPKLTVELVPIGTWGSNLRSLLTKSQWDKLRKHCYAEAGHVCEICGDSGLNQGRKHAVEAHEVWTYDDAQCVQTLERVIVLCPRCHQVKHMGRTLKYGGGYKARAHMAKVNGMTEQGQRAYEELAFLVHALRSRFRWSVNINALAHYAGEGLPLTAEQVKAAIKKVKSGGTA